MFSIVWDSIRSTNIDGLDTSNPASGGQAHTNVEAQHSESSSPGASNGPVTSSSSTHAPTSPADSLDNPSHEVSLGGEDGDLDNNVISVPGHA
ncbi:hypothetical protein L1887_14333 [Cichorium endivia]|nr:hypothetical protein L1887_14333 [Cichorium endivia]